MKRLRPYPKLGTLLLATLVAGSGAPRADGAPPTRRNVEIEWDAVEGATAYEVRVTRKDGGAKPLTFKLKTSHWSANVKAGLYLMQLRAYDDRGVPGEWSPESELNVKLAAVIIKAPAPRATIAAQDDDEETVRLAWEEIPGARSYRVTVTSGEERQTLESKTPALAVKLKVARAYAWNVVGVDDRGQEGEASPTPYSFTLNGPALAAPAPERPLTKYVERVRWAAVPHAASYETSLSVFDRARRAWTPVPGPSEVTGHDYAFDTRQPGGRYRLSVRAVGDRRAASPKATVVFTAVGGFTDPAAMDDARLRESLRPDGRYVVNAQYLAGPVDYTSRYAETNALASLSGVTNVARFGVTRPAIRGRWGASAGADVDNFAIRGHAFVYGALEARALYRLTPGRRGVLTFDAGLFTKQLPVVIGSPNDGFARVERVGVSGPLAGVTYAHPFSERWSARAEARAYYGQGGAFAHEAGVGAGYRYGPRLMLIGGVSERHDEATFKAKTGGGSFARPGESDRVTMDALSLRLGLDYGF